MDRDSEDDFTRLVSGQVQVDVTRNGLGARGIDQIEKTTSTATTTVFPLYDGHGNMVATLSRSGFGFAVNDKRTFDAWGLVRTGAQNGDPKRRYCANLGHVQDDESGLIYMRARYYEALSGRFVSEDPARQGLNWFTYCRNMPTVLIDESGRAWSPNWGLFVLQTLSFLVGSQAMFLGALVIATSWDPVEISNGYMLATTGSFMYTLGLLFDEGTSIGTIVTSALYLAAGEAMSGLLKMFQLEKSVLGVSVSSKTAAGIAVSAVFAYSLIVLAYLVYEMTATFTSD